MLEDLTIDTFTGLGEQRFELLAGDAVFPLELVESKALSDQSGSPHSNRIPFSLLFRGAPDLHLPQQIHHLRHPELGELDVFLVPIQPDAGGSLYEAVFN